MKKQIIFIFVLILAVVGIVLIITNTGHIRDTNGTDTNLAKIDLAQRIEEEKYNYTSTPEGNMKTGSPSGVEDSSVDYTGITYNVKKVTGVKVLQETYLAEGEELLITVATDLSEGNIQIVIVSPSNEIVETFNVSEFDHTFTLSGEVGVYKVVIGAESARVTMVISREIVEAN